MENVLQSVASSSESLSEVGRPNVFREMVEAELALWTFSLSALFAYVYRKRYVYPLFSVLVVTPTVLCVTGMLSSVLIATILFSRLFSPTSTASPTAVDYANWLPNGRHRRDSDSSQSSIKSEQLGYWSAPNFFWQRRRSLEKRFATIYRKRQD